MTRPCDAQGASHHPALRSGWFSFSVPNLLQHCLPSFKSYFLGLLFLKGLSGAGWTPRLLFIMSFPCRYS